MKRITIADVAQRAGVSKSTVSHALSGNRPISAATRQRVRLAAAALGYHPNPVAQRLAGSATRTIGCVMPLFRPQIAGVEFEFVKSAAVVLAAADYAFLLLTYMEQNPTDVGRIAAGGVVDGLMLMQVALEDERVESLRHGPVPFVMLGRCADNRGLTFVDSDIEAGLRAAVDHLAALGHTQIAYLHQDMPRFGFAHRARRGFEDACRARGLAGRCVPCALTQDSGESAMHALLEQAPATSAVIVWNDAAALGAVHAARQRGRSIPDDLSLICTNPTSLPELAALTPTVIDIQAEELATRATELMLALVSGEEQAAVQILTAPRFVPGASTAPRFVPGASTAPRRAP